MRRLCFAPTCGRGYYVSRVAANPLARTVKMADLEDNLDVSRLPSLGQDDLERLNRYLDAWRRLTEASP